MIRRGEIQLFLGLGSLAGSVVLFSFVIIGLLAFPLFPVAALVALTGLIRARERVPLTRRQVVGLLLSLAGITALVFGCSIMVDAAYQYALFSQRHQGPLPSPQYLLLSVVVCLLVAVLVWFGLLFWTNWSPKRRFTWSAILFFVPPATFASYRFLATWLAIDA